MDALAVQRGIFFFTGPSGVGKTEMAVTMAEVSNRKVLRYDMSEYQSEHEVSKLIGAPPGYVGHQQGGKLIKEVNEQPTALLLFDEIEKAHGSVHKALLGVLDAARLKIRPGKYS